MLVERAPQVALRAAHAQRSRRAAIDQIAVECGAQAARRELEFRERAARAARSLEACIGVPGRGDAARERVEDLAIARQCTFALVCRFGEPVAEVGVGAQVVEQPITAGRIGRALGHVLVHRGTEATLGLCGRLARGGVVRAQLVEYRAVVGQQLVSDTRCGTRKRNAFGRRIVQRVDRELCAARRVPVPCKQHECDRAETEGEARRDAEAPTPVARGGVSHARTLLRQSRWRSPTFDICGRGFPCKDCSSHSPQNGAPNTRRQADTSPAKR